ncbi:hypothetical protein [Denitratisoma sp. DHT3]|uniref:hypothetical protein n=1 Tax=Denitratisoma sp. DHT3 TaxID=1981880 RepID=UPI0011A5A01B|nr:hypothetical protein [Denitratisoma sp. DHT3]
MEGFGMKRPHQFLRWLIAVIAVMVLAGCASTPELVSHGFAFDFIDDSPEAELLDYRYGTSYYGKSERQSLGRVSQGKGIFGEIRRGDDLYVKWRLKATGEVFEETIDLRNRLSKDIRGSEIYFLVRGPQLYVYLITPKKRAKDEPPNGPSKWSFRHILTIYPDSPKN